MGSDEPVWITGIGAATPLGCGLAEIESKLLAGRSGVTRVTRFPTDDYPSRIAAQLGPVPGAGRGATLGDSRRGPRWSRSRAGAARRPCAMPGCWGTHREMRVGLVLGLGAEWMFLWETDHLAGGTGCTTRSRTGNRRSSGRGATWGSRGRRWALGGVRQRQPRAGGRPALAAAGPG